MRGSLPLISIASILFGGLVAHADTYTLTISGSDTGTVTLTGSSNASTDAGAILLTSGSGVIDGRAVVLTPAPVGTNFAHQYDEPNSGIFVDDELYPAQSRVFDPAGIELTTTDAGPLRFFVPYNDPAFGGANLFVFDSATRTIVSDRNVTFSLSSATTNPVPEPSSILLMSTGIAGLAGFARRFRTAKA